MDNAVALRADRKNCDSMLGTIALECGNLLGRLWLTNGQVLILRGNIMVGAGRHLRGTKNLDATLSQACKSLWTCYLVYILSVDI